MLKIFYYLSIYCEYSEHKQKEPQIGSFFVCLLVIITQTENALKNGTSKIQNVAISGELVSENAIYTNDLFTASGNLANQTFNFTDGFVGMTDGRGAVEASNMWMSGWTR